MRYVHALLTAKGLAPPDPAGFKSLLHSLWFEPYSRDGAGDSSGFEHVFVGEVRGGAGPEAGAALGIHNWIAILAAEGAGDLNYYGHLRPRTGARKRRRRERGRERGEREIGWEGRGGGLSIPSRERWA